jgi:lysozyme family protein
MAYVDYSYYMNTYKGSKITSESEFVSSERKAELYLNRETYGNITSETDISDNVKMCICELAEASYSFESVTHDKSITSERVGDYSVSYASQVETDNNYKKAIRDTIHLYLDNPVDAHLLYRGLR